MSDRAYIATRKGLFEVYRTHEAWLLDSSTSSAIRCRWCCRTGATARCTRR
jgi:hypothetical protein